MNCAIQKSDKSKIKSVYKTLNRCRRFYDELPSQHQTPKNSVDKNGFMMWDRYHPYVHTAVGSNTNVLRMVLDEGSDHNIKSFYYDQYPLDRTFKVNDPIDKTKLLLVYGCDPTIPRGINNVLLNYPSYHKLLDLYLDGGYPTSKIWYSMIGNLTFAIKGKAPKVQIGFWDYFVKDCGIKFPDSIKAGL